MDSGADDVTNQRAELQAALTNFEGMKVAALAEQGVDVGHLYVDPAKYRNALHELVLNYISYSVQERPPKLHIKFLDILAVLLQHGLDINEKDAKHLSALHHVASSPGHPDIIKALVSSGARVNLPDTGQQTPLHKAVLTGSVPDVTMLLEQGADPNVMDNMGHSPIHVAVKRRNNREVLKVLIGCGGKVNLNHPEWSRSNRGATPLHVAARLGRVENGFALLDMGADPNIPDGAGQTPLHTAAGHDITGHLCSRLVKDGARVDVHDTMLGETALHKAVRACVEENVHVLITRRASPNDADLAGNTALHKAATCCHDMAIWRHLLAAGGRPGVMNAEGQLPLHRAAKAKNGVALMMLKVSEA